MRNLSIVQIGVISGAIILLGLIYFGAGTTPNKEIVSNTRDAISDLDAKIDIAISYVKDGNEPMKGIALLKEVIEEDPENIKAHLTLGFFSIQSGQYEKAIERFEKVLSIDSGYIEAYLYLADIYENTGKTNKAIKILNKYKTLIKDSVIINEVENHITELKNI